MYMHTAITALIFAATSITSVQADSCYAVGSLNTNSEGWGLGGTTYAGSQGISLYNSDDELIGTYDLCDTCSGVCSDFISVPTSNLSQVFEWGASCGSGNFEYDDISLKNLNLGLQVTNFDCSQRMPWCLWRSNSHRW